MGAGVPFRLLVRDSSLVMHDPTGRGHLVGPRTVLMPLERRTLEALRDHGSVASTAHALNMSLGDLARDLTAIRTRLQVSSTAAALDHLTN